MKNSYTATHSINTRNNYCLHRQTTDISCFWKGMYCAYVKIFKSLPCTLTGLTNKGTQFKFKFNTNFHCTKPSIKLNQNSTVLCFMSVFPKSLESNSCF